MVRRPTTQLDLDGLAQLQWFDLAPELQDRLHELLADLLRKAAAGAAEARDEQ